MVSHYGVMPPAVFGSLYNITEKISFVKNFFEKKVSFYLFSAIHFYLQFFPICDILISRLKDKMLQGGAFLQQFNIVKLAQRLLLVVIVFLCGMTAAFAADARWTDGTSVAEGTLAEMMAKVNQSGGTVILLQDYTYSSTSGSAITANKSFTLDLNGKTLTSKSTGISVTDKADGITTIKNGTIIASRMCVAVKGGAGYHG